MLKCQFRFLIVCIRKSKRIDIIRISQIAFRSLYFLYIIGKSQRQVCGKLRHSIISSCHFLNQSAFLYNNRSICIFNVTGCIKSKNFSIQRIFCILILLCHNHFCFLSVIRKGCLRKNNIYILSCIRKSDRLFFPGIIKSGRSLFFFDDICTKMQVFQNDCPIRVCCQILFDQITLAVNLGTISSFNICPGIHIINRTFLSAFLILKCCSILGDICTCQNLTFFINSQLAHLFFIRNSHSCCFADFQFYVVGSCIDTVSCRSCNLFQIYSVLCLNDLYGRFPICIGCR